MAMKLVNPVAMCRTRGGLPGLSRGNRGKLVASFLWEMETGMDTWVVMEEGEVEELIVDQFGRKSQVGTLYAPDNRDGRDGVFTAIQHASQRAISNTSVADLKSMNADTAVAMLSHNPTSVGKVLVGLEARFRGAGPHDARLFSLQNIMSQTSLPLSQCLFLFQHIDQLSSDGDGDGDGDGVESDDGGGEDGTTIEDGANDDVLMGVVLVSGLNDVKQMVGAKLPDHWAVVVDAIASAAGEACDPEADAEVLAQAVPVLEDALSRASGPLGLYVSLSLLYNVLCSSAESLVWCLDTATREQILQMGCGTASRCCEEVVVGGGSGGDEMGLWLVAQALEVLGQLVMWTGAVEGVLWNADRTPGAPALSVAAEGGRSIAFGVGMEVRGLLMAMGVVTPRALFGIPWEGKYFVGSRESDGVVWGEDGKVVHEMLEMVEGEGDRLREYVVALLESPFWARDPIASLFPCPRLQLVYASLLSHVKTGKMIVLAQSMDGEGVGKGRGRGRGGPWPHAHRRSVLPPPPTTWSDLESVLSSLTT